MEWWLALGIGITKVVAKSIVGSALDPCLDWAIEFLIDQLLY